LKGYTIATQVFGRGDHFDQNTDPIVSIQANKLRRAMERYYLTAGVDDPLHIDIPKGSYVPVFYKKSIPTEPKDASEKATPSHRPGQPWPTVLVKPFTNITHQPENDYFGIGLSTEISVALSRYQDIRVLMYGADGRAKRASDVSARFVVSGSVRKDETQVSVNVHMIDSTNHIHVFGKSFKAPLEPLKIIAIEEEIIETIALFIAGEHGAISRNLLQESRAKPPHDQTTYEAILKYYEYDRLFTPETYLAALEALTRASENEPDCGQVWSMLGRLYAENAVHEFFNSDVTLEQAMAYATKGVLSNPDNQRARLILAVIKMFADDIISARIEVERALALNPESLLFMDVIGYLLTLLGDWKQGPKLLKKALKLNPFNHNFVYYGSWLFFFHEKDYKAAYREALKLTIGSSYWEPLARAATLGQMGRIEEGQKAARELMALKPDFQSKGRRLIRYYIKFDEIIDRVVEGLTKVGVGVD
jgi:adenylate cyclase